MPRDVAEKAIDYATIDDPDRVQISYFGGEPFLEYDRMVEYTELARTQLASADRRLKFVVTTNGTGFNKRRLAYLAENDFFVGFSIDGIEAAQNATRPKINGGGSFQAVYQGLRQIVRSSVDFETISVIDPANVEYLGATARFLIEAGVRRISFNPNFYCDWTDESLELWERGYREVAEAWLASYRRGHLIYINIIDDKVITHLKGGFKDHDHCEFGKAAIAVAPSGNIYPCERLVAEDRDLTYCIGNVTDGFSARRAGLIEASGNHCDDCDDCALFDRCMNFCACANIADTGNLGEPGGLVCWHEQVAVAVADQAAATLYREHNPMFLQTYYLR
jgi:uncharacterized protein